VITQTAPQRSQASCEERTHELEQQRNRTPHRAHEPRGGLRRWGVVSLEIETVEAARDGALARRRGDRGRGGAPVGAGVTGGGTAATTGGQGAGGHRGGDRTGIGGGGSGEEP
jgi:hypothetical protein